MDLDRTGDAGHLFHLVLYADLKDETRLMEMLTQLLLLPQDTAVRRLGDLATKGRTVLMTCDRANADLSREQIETYLQSVPATGPVRLAVERVYARPN